jgi:hypothetical protein
MFLTTGWEGYSDVLISMESMLNKDYSFLFMDFSESLTLAMLQSGLNTMYTSMPLTSRQKRCDRKEIRGRPAAALLRVRPSAR